MPMAQWGRTVLYQWTHWAVAGPGGVDVLPGALVADEFGLVQGVEGLGQSEAERSPALEPAEATASHWARVCP